MAPTGPERSSGGCYRRAVYRVLVPCAARSCCSRQKEYFKETGRKEKRSLVAPIGLRTNCPIAWACPQYISLIIPRTLQPAEVWGIVLGNVWEKILTRFRKNCLCRQMMQKAWPAVACGTPHTFRDDRPVCGNHARIRSAGLC